MDKSCYKILERYWKINEMSDVAIVNSELSKYRNSFLPQRQYNCRGVVPVTVLFSLVHVFLCVFHWSSQICTPLCPSRSQFSWAGPFNSYPLKGSTITYNCGYFFGASAINEVEDCCAQIDVQRRHWICILASFFIWARNRRCFLGISFIDCFMWCPERWLFIVLLNSC